MLDSFPDKKVTLDLVVSKAILASDDFKKVEAQIPSLVVPSLQAKALLEPRFYIQLSRRDDQQEASNSFQPVRTLSRQYTLGASKAFTTGTSLSAEIQHGYRELVFTSLTIPSFYETSGSITLSQSLWNNAFGYSIQRTQEVAELSSKSNLWALVDSTETWVCNLIELYYQTWGAQAQTQVAQENLERRKKLLNITNIKKRRGTSETQDQLQVESALLGAETQKANAEQSLEDIWRALVTSLKLPQSWLHLDPREIPMGIDSPVQSALTACGPSSKLNPPPKDTAILKKVQLDRKAARLNLERAKNSAAPELELQLQGFGNGIDVQRGQSLDESLRLDNPGWAIGINFSVPLNNFEAQADIRGALTQKLTAEAEELVESAQNKLNWINACTQLHQLEANHKRIASALKKQKRRATIEERLFSIGRSPTINVIQAEDDATAAQSQWIQSEVDRRLAAWKVQKLNGAIVPYLNGLGITIKQQDWLK